MSKPILCVDFDGVIHQYDGKWEGEHVVSGNAVPGAIEFIDDCAVMFDVHIFSSRSKTEAGRTAMRKWLRDQLKDRFGMEEAMDILMKIKFPMFKPPAKISLDDRAIQFEGFFPYPEDLMGFQPYWKRKE